MFLFAIVKTGVGERCLFRNCNVDKLFLSGHERRDALICKKGCFNFTSQIVFCLICQHTALILLYCLLSYCFNTSLCSTFVMESIVTGYKMGLTEKNRARTGCGWGEALLQQPFLLIWNSATFNQIYWDVIGICRLYCHVWSPNRNWHIEKTQTPWLPCVWKSFTSL